MAEQIVCAFYATRRFLGNACRELEGNDLVEGSVVLKKLSDVDYNFEFILDCGFVTICADIDDFRLVESSKFQIVTEDQCVYAIDDRSDYLLFRDAVHECQLLMEVSYQFTLIKSNHFTKLSKALAIDNAALRCVDYMVLNYEEYQVPETISDQTKERYSDPLVILDGVRNIICVFCKAEKVMEKNLTFALHPYVPMNFEKKNIYMCFRCLDNWRQFREEAICDDTLLPEDEINEDLCGICSVSASELFMCASCPRSFCGPCLEFTLTAQQVVQVKEPQDWICMCCAAQVSSITPSAMSSDWCIAVVEYAHLLPDDPYMIRQNPLCIQDSPLPVMCIEDDSAGEVENTIEISQHHDPPNIFPLVHISHKRVREAQQPFIDSLAAKCNGDHISSHDASKVARKGEEISTPIERVIKEVSQEKNEKFLKVDYPTDRARNWHGSSNKNTTVLTAHDDIPVIPLDYGVDHGQCCEDVNTEGRITDNDEVSHTEQASLPESKEDKNTTTVEVVDAIDAVHYFTRYLQDLELSSQKVQAGTGKMKYPTDDVCFLCKDGGDLLECDYVHRDLPVRRPCQRVYHRHCLPFVVPSKSKNWKCPRHYCDFCGNSKLRYMCKYCPMSACAACSKPGGSGKILNATSAMECSTQFTDNIRLMTCDSCAVMIARCNRGQAEPRPTLERSPSASHPSKPSQSQSVACRPCKKSTKKNRGPRSGTSIRSRED